MATADLEILIKARDEATAVLKQAQGQVQSFSQSLEGINKIATGAALGVGIQQTIGFLGDATKAAAEDEASTLRVQKAIENTGASYGEYAKRLDDTVKRGHELAFSSEQTRDSISLLAAETSNADQAFQRYALAQDLARGTGLDIITASRLLGKVTDENVRVLGRYGITVRQGATDTELFTAIMQKFGGQAQTFADSAAGSMERFNQQIEETKKKLGEGLLPLAEQGPKAASLFDKLVTGVIITATAPITLLKTEISGVNSLLSSPATKNATADTKDYVAAAIEHRKALFEVKTVAADAAHSIDNFDQFVGSSTEETTAARGAIADLANSFDVLQGKALDQIAQASKETAATNAATLAWDKSTAGIDALTRSTTEHLQITAQEGAVTDAATLAYYRSAAGVDALVQANQRNLATQQITTRAANEANIQLLGSVDGYKNLVQIDEQAIAVRNLETRAQNDAEMAYRLTNNGLQSLIDTEKSQVVTEFLMSNVANMARLEVLKTADGFARLVEQDKENIAISDIMAKAMAEANREMGKQDSTAKSLTSSLNGLAGATKNLNDQTVSRNPFAAVGPGELLRGITGGAQSTSSISNNRSLTINGGVVIQVPQLNSPRTFATALSGLDYAAAAGMP